MALKKSLLSGVVAFVVATVAVRAVAGERSGAKVGLVAAVAVAARTLLAGRGADAPEELSVEEPAQ